MNNNLENNLANNPAQTNLGMNPNMMPNMGNGMQESVNAPANQIQQPQMSNPFETNSAPVNSVPVQPQVQVVPEQPTNQPIDNDQNQMGSQNNFQSVPTIEQSNQNFVANTQTISSEKPVEQKNKVNYLLIIILLGSVFLAIFFLFPMLKNIF